MLYSICRKSFCQLNGKEFRVSTKSGKSEKKRTEVRKKYVFLKKYQKILYKLQGFQKPRILEKPGI